MSSPETKKSLAVSATESQGSDNYLGHDTYQNGLLNNDNSRIYMAGWGENWGATKGASGYFTDQATINSCMDGNKLDTNKLDAALQTKLSDYSTKDTTGAFQAHSHVSAYDINFDRLKELNNKDSNLYDPDLYNKLTNPDGQSPNGTDIKVAFGKAEANTQHGNGGGNQYYIDPETFREAERKGVFVYNEKASFSLDSKENPIQRHDISASKYNEKYASRLKKAEIQEIKRESMLAAEREGTGQTKEQQINSQVVKNDLEQPYIARPDSAYNYSQTENTGKASTSAETSNVSSQNIAAITGGGSNAPPSDTHKSDSSDKQIMYNLTGTGSQENKFTPVKQEDISGKERASRESFSRFSDDDLAKRNEMKAGKGTDSAIQSPTVNNGLNGYDRKANGTGMGV